jgi:hypothetical protein
VTRAVAQKLVIQSSGHSSPEAGSIREASRRLNISASAVSRQVLQLEEAVGISPNLPPLFQN